MGVTCLGAVGFLSSVCLPALSGALFLALRACNFIDHVVHQCRSSWFLQDRSCGVSFGTRLVLFMQAFPFVEVINVVACGLSVLHIVRNEDADCVGLSSHACCGLPVVSGMCIIVLTTRSFLMFRSVNPSCSYTPALRFLFPFAFRTHAFMRPYALQPLVSQCGIVFLSGSSCWAERLCSIICIKGVYSTFLFRGVFR